MLEDDGAGVLNDCEGMGVLQDELDGVSNSVASIESSF